MKKSDWRDTLGALLPDDYVAPDEPKVDENTPPRPALKIMVDRKRAGKIATIIAGFEPDDERAAELAALLKKKLGAGGSTRDGEILIQGDRAEQLVKLLPTLGYKAKKATSL